MLEKYRNKPIVINTDLDGILSGFLLQKYLNCKIVGFSNSAESIWLNEQAIDNFSQLCFIDIFIARPDIMCLDQHIIAVNEQHHEIISKNENKLNPNLLNPRFHIPDASYRRKYPFGTVHFIIALLEKLGIELDAKITETHAHNLSAIDFILRADDSMKTTVSSKYMNNANEWWQWLKSLSNDGKTINNLIEYLDNLSEEKVLEIKKRIGNLLQSDSYACDSSDGGILELTYENNLIKPTAIEYFQGISSLLNIELFDVKSTYKKWEGTTKRMSLTSQQEQELINKNSIDGKDVFSYAFVRMKGREDNFSVTFFN